MDAMYEEDKTCRICATVNCENFNIFNGKDRNLHDKILSVYPMIIYKDDPLPKSICTRCAGYVSCLYVNMQKILKTQKKWIDNVRTNQPDHNFVKVLDIIERNHRDTVKEVMEVTNGEFIMPPSLEPPRLLKLNIDNPNQKSFTYFDSESLNKNQVTVSTVTASKAGPPCPKSKKLTINELTLPILNTNEITIEPCKKSNVSIPTMKRLQSLLESNGCSLYTVSGNNKEKNATPVKMTTLQSLLLSPLKASPVPSTPIKKEYNCNYCSFKSFDLNDVACHGLKHLTIPINKIFEKKFLPKSSRKGRMITIYNRRCIRCLNCWRVFLDNKSILEHWAKGKCDYYCQICNKDYSQSPKMLREHVPAAHGISFRSSKRREELSSVLHGNEKGKKYGITKIKTIEKTPNIEAIATKPEIKENEKIENPSTSYLNNFSFSLREKKKLDDKVTCSLCQRVFSNFKARNSHMRAHKRPFFLSSKQVDISHDCLAIKEEPTDYDRDIKPIFVKKTATTTSDSLSTDTTIRTLRPSQPTLKVKSLSELQDPRVSSQLLEEESHSSKSSKEDQVVYRKVFSCYPCKEKFGSKLDLFRHKRKCKANNSFVCQFCTKAFTTSADLQLHLILTHKN